MPPGSSEKTAVSLTTYGSLLLKLCAQRRQEAEPFPTRWPCKGHPVQSCLQTLLQLNRQLSVITNPTGASLAVCRMQQTAEIPPPSSSAWETREVMSARKSNLSFFLFLFHRKTIPWLDPKPVPSTWGHKHVPAPSSHLPQKLTAAPGARNPAQEEGVPKSAQTSCHQTQCLRSCCQLCPDVGQYLGLVSLWKAFWTTWPVTSPLLDFQMPFLPKEKRMSDLSGFQLTFVSGFVVPLKQKQEVKP